MEKELRENPSDILLLQLDRKWPVKNRPKKYRKGLCSEKRQYKEQNPVLD